MDNAPPTTHRISEFHKWEKEKALELAPPFQRKPVWSPRNKSYLIDTITKGLPIPEIYLQVKTDKEGHTKYIVVDGQQRIRAILEYLEGEYAIGEEETSEFAGKEFSKLSDGVKKDFWDYSLVVRELKTTKDNEIREVFQRLNKNVVPLNRQELRNATYVGDFIKLANELSNDDYWAEQKIVNPAEIRRMIDTEFASELLIGLLHGIQPKEPDLIDKYYKLYDDDFKEINDAKNKFLKVKSKINDILGELKSTRWHYKLDYYSLFMAFAELMENYYFPDERHEDISKALNDFSNLILKEKFENPFVKSYYEAQLTRRANTETRTLKRNALRSILLQFLIAKDSKRQFNEEERRIFWELSKDKKCALCKGSVKWEEYELDHITPHSKGGKTELKNAQITHKSCNASKGAK